MYLFRRQLTTYHEALMHDSRSSIKIEMPLFDDLHRLALFVFVPRAHVVSMVKGYTRTVLFQCLGKSVSSVDNPSSSGHLFSVSPFPLNWLYAFKSHRYGKALYIRTGLRIIENTTHTKLRGLLCRLLLLFGSY